METGVIFILLLIVVPLGYLIVLDRYPGDQSRGLSDRREQWKEHKRRLSQYKLNSERMLESVASLESSLNELERAYASNQDIAGHIQKMHSIAETCRIRAEQLDTAVREGNMYNAEAISQTLETLAERLQDEVDFLKKYPGQRKEPYEQI